MHTRYFGLLLVGALGAPGAGIAATSNLLPRASVEALGMADANVALSSGPAAQFVNPANLDGGSGADRWELGAFIGRITNSLDRPAPAGTTAAGTYDGEPVYPLVPAAAATFSLSPRLHAGFGIDVPYGSSSKWPDGSFERALPGGNADIALEAELRAVRLGVAAAYGLDERWSVGARLFGQYVYARERSDLSTIEGDGTSAGYQLGVRYRSPGFVFGSSYTSRTRTELEGELSDVHPAAAAAGVRAGDGRVDIYLPDRWQTGFAFRLGQELWWETDFDWVGWSYVDRLAIEQSDGSLANAGRDARHYHDTVSVYTALKWQFASDLTLYAGLGYDPTPIDERDVTPTVSMVRKTRLGLGFMRELGEGWSVGLAYQFIYGHDRQVSDTVQDGDTRLYEGSYSSRTHVLGVSVGGRF